jgi:ribonuclease Z
VDWKTRLKGIWISHAHLDHYGGLPTLLRIIHDAKGSRKTLQTSSSKKPRIESSVPWVVAPPKVLHFLDILLHCHHGRKKDNNQQLFVPRLHHDPTVPPGPWKHFQNVKVHHNCCPSYGLLIGGFTPSSWLCYSGDTRPCFALVQECRKARRHDPNSSLLLIHEASFQDQDQEEAYKKKHSTVSEAIQVATDIPATRVLLTHFSQRNVSLRNNKKSTSDEPEDATRATPTPNSISSIPAGLAMDGLWLNI